MAISAAPVRRVHARDQHFEMFLPKEGSAPGVAHLSEFQSRQSDETRYHCQGAANAPLERGAVDVEPNAGSAGMSALPSERYPAKWANRPCRCTVGVNLA